MFTLPILSFYIGMYIFQNKAEPVSYAGGLAILTTNLIIAGYVYSAFQEPEEERVEKKNKNDEDAPRVGVFKQRVD